MRMGSVSYTHLDVYKRQTIINDYGKFALHLLPSGVFYQHTTSIIGNGVALNIPYLVQEIEARVERGVPKPRILVSDRAQILMPVSYTHLDVYKRQVIMSPRKLIGARDPFGFKPLCIGKRDNAYILASEDVYKRQDPTLRKRASFKNK